MARYKNIKEEKKEEIKEEIKIPLPVMSLNKYLSNYSSHRRNLDKVIVSWFMKKDGSNPKKEQTEWAKLIVEFFSETE